jgi:hypothetical protein
MHFLFKKEIIQIINEVEYCVSNKNKPVIMTKLMIVRNREKAVQLEKVMGPEWLVVGFDDVLVGRRFDIILLVDQPMKEENIIGWAKYVNSEIKTRLAPGGQLIEVY